MKTFWKVLYNIVLAFTHICGVNFAVAVCLVRGKFYYQWTVREDILLCLLLAAVLGIHYLLIFLGHKKSILHHITNKIMQVYEWVMGAIFMVFLLYFVDTLVEVKAALPTIAFCVAMLILRHLWIKKTKRSKTD